MKQVASELLQRADLEFCKDKIGTVGEMARDIIGFLEDLSKNPIDQKKQKLCRHIKECSIVLEAELAAEDEERTGDLIEATKSMIKFCKYALPLLGVV